MARPVGVSSWDASRTLSMNVATPKSNSFTECGRPSAELTRMFSGFRSRWTIPYRCTRLERVEHLSDDERGPSDRPGTPLLEEFAGALAADVLHHDEGRPALVHPHVHDVDDEGVLDAGGRPSLPLEPGERHPVIGQVRMQDLDRHRATDGGVLCLVDAPHAAVAEQTPEAVLAPDEGADPVPGSLAGASAGRREHPVTLPEGPALPAPIVRPPRQTRFAPGWGAPERNWVPKTREGHPLARAPFGRAHAARSRARLRGPGP